MTSTFKKGLWQEIGKPLQTKYLKLLGFERRLFSLNILPFEGKATGVFSSLSTRNLVQQSTDQSPPYTHPPTRCLPLSVANFSYISSIQPPQTSSESEPQTPRRCLEEVVNRKATQVFNLSCSCLPFPPWAV